MTGLILHPLRLKALTEGRLSVLRVPSKKQPAATAEFHHLDCVCNAVFTDGTVIPAPYAPGDYFVKEAWAIATDFGYCTDRIFYKASYVNGGIYDDVKKWQSARSMPEEHARYILTLGPPVPCRLGEVDVSAMQQEGVFASLMQDPCDMAKQIKHKYRDQWNQIYGKKHPWLPELWTWGFPVTWRKR